MMHIIVLRPLAFTQTLPRPTQNNVADKHTF